MTSPAKEERSSLISALQADPCFVEVLPNGNFRLWDSGALREVSRLHATLIASDLMGSPYPQSQAKAEAIKQALMASQTQEG
jgi:hypothetical protein